MPELLNVLAGKRIRIPIDPVIAYAPAFLGLRSKLLPCRHLHVANFCGTQGLFGHEATSGSNSVCWASQLSYTYHNGRTRAGGTPFVRFFFAAYASPSSSVATFSLTLSSPLPRLLVAVLSFVLLANGWQLLAG